jgi:hypothetical protein
VLSVVPAARRARKCQRAPLQGASTHSSEKGTEYELEFEDEYDSGTIARSETLFFARSRFVGINRLVEF